MALSKTIELPNGAVATYFNILSIRVNKDGSGEVVVRGYKDAAFRQNKPGVPMYQDNFSVPAGTLSLTAADPATAAYTFLKGQALFAEATDV